MIRGGGVFEREEISRFSWKNFQMKMLAGSAAVIFGVAVLLMSVLAISNPAVVHPSSESGTLVSDAPATSASLIKMVYYLPYPGILPDSPLYKIKALRDRIALWLTFDPVEKATKELLYADKRINAAIFLLQGGKVSLGVSTATKAEKYLESAAGLTIGEAKKGKDVKSLLLSLDKSAQKHQEVLGELIGKVTGADRAALQAAVKTNQAADERIKQALLDK